MKSIMLILIVLSISCSCIGMPKGLRVQLKEQNANYPSICNIHVAPDHYYENSDDDSNAGMRYRVVVTLSEIYYSLFIEKITIDIEGSPVNIVWSKKIDINSLIEHLGLSQETTMVGKVVFSDYSNFTFLLGDKKVAMQIIDKDEEVQAYAHILKE